MDHLLKAAYPQALSKLIAITHDISIAEDCLQSACEKAINIWPQQEPESPVAWLITVARNSFIDWTRRESKSRSIELFDEPIDSTELSEKALLESFNDDLLRLIFTSCHPALKPETQIALSLKHVLGLSTKQIAAALLIPQKTLEQRLTRAKKKIAANGIEYEIPAPHRRKERLHGVLKTIYLLFNEGYFSTDNEHILQAQLCREAIRLGRLLHQASRGEAEVLGLLALMLHLDARREARFNQAGELVILSEQNRKLWNAQKIQEANQLVEKALMIGKGTPYALQAAIASLHNNAQDYASTDWPQIYELYKLLNKIAPNPIVEINGWIAFAQFSDANIAIEKIKLLEKSVGDYRQFNVTIAGLYYEENNFEAARKYYSKALDFVNNATEESFITKRLNLCNDNLNSSS